MYDTSIIMRPVSVEARAKMKLKFICIYIYIIYIYIYIYIRTCFLIKRGKVFLTNHLHDTRKTAFKERHTLFKFVF